MTSCLCEDEALLPIGDNTVSNTIKQPFFQKQPLPDLNLC